MEAKKLQGDSIRLRWSRCPNGYMLVDRPSDKFDLPFDWAGNEDESGPFIVPKSELIVNYEVALGEVKIFADLIQSDDSDKGLLDFSYRWGMLGPWAKSKRVYCQFRDQLRHVYRSRFKISELARALESQTLGGAKIEFGRKSRSGSIDLRWYVLTLSAFCWLEVIEDLGDVDRSSVGTCDACGRFFTRTSVKGPAPDHCSNACRQRAYRQRQAKR